MNRRVHRPHPRARLRRALFVAGLLPALLVLAYTVKVVLMLQHNAAGRDAFERGDYDGAAAEFFDTRDLNWFQPWVAPFDEGTAHHAEGAFDKAIAAYEDALDVVPRREECTVRINLALAHEAVGDRREAGQDHDGAVASWQAGIDVLEEGDCPTDAGRGEDQREDAAGVEERLADKIEQSEQQQQQQPSPQQPPPPQPGDQPDEGDSDPREERLQRNNERGADQRGEEQDLYGDEDYTRPETW